jgi:hypothetical protein
MFKSGGGVESDAGGIPLMAISSTLASVDAR